jgi:hypothetical protein
VSRPNPAAAQTISRTKLFHAKHFCPVGPEIVTRHHMDRRLESVARMIGTMRRPEL